MKSASDIPLVLDFAGVEVFFFAMLQMIADMWYSVAMAHQGVRRKHKRKDYMTFGAAHNKPLTVTQVDGTQTVVPALSRKQLQTIIRKGHNSR